MNQRQQRGMTLLEVLVALFIFAIAASSAVRLVGTSAQTLSQLESRQLAYLVAHNQLVLVGLAQQSPSEGQVRGEKTLGGQTFGWQRNVMATPDPRMRRVEIAVHLKDAPDHRLAALTLFRDIGS